MRRLGSWLVARGLCTQAQVDKALQSKVVYGGRLGTNLVELGHLTLEELETELAEMHEVPVAPAKWLEASDEAARGAVARDNVEKHGWLPLRIDGGTLHVAMRDPSDPEQLDALRAAGGQTVQPYAVSELRLGVLLEHHYGIAREVRYTQDEAPDEDDPADALDRDAGELIDEETFASLHSEWETRSYGAGAGAEIELTDLGESGKTSTGAGTEETAAEVEARILRAPNREAVADEAFRLTRRFVSASALLMVRGGVVAGFRGDGSAVPERINGIMLPVEADSAVARVAVTSQPFRGPVGESGLDRMILHALDRDGACEILVLPISLRGRVVNLLYADAGGLPLAETTCAALEALCRLIAHAYRALILVHKQRAREEGGPGA